ncbi:DUF3093 domain-containing protein [Georgenia sunbinii]|uniref:DUF3093 domain-containing protein n=1 Tax=Georgenia sunbinii TaxID=3117728 RepID=UPI002F2672B9
MTRNSAPSSAPLYRERLLPRVTTLALAVLGGAAVGAIPWVFSTTAGYVVGAFAAVVFVGLLLASSPLVVVDVGDVAAGQPPSLQAGPAHIELEHLGEPEVLDADGMRLAMGPQAHLRAYVCQRPWISRGVKVAVTDRRDPAPYWLVASRRPAALAQALRQAGQAAHSEQTSWPPSS